MTLTDSLNSVLRYSQADEGSFHRAIADNLGESTHSLVYADWLQEQGKEGHAEVIRNHCQRTGGGPGIYHRDYDPNQGREFAAYSYTGGLGPHEPHIRLYTGTPENRELNWWASFPTHEEREAVMRKLEAEGAFTYGDYELKNPERHSRLRYSLADEERAFHRSIHLNSKERSTGLVYADWLQEQGREAHAEVVRQNHDYWNDSGQVGGSLPAEGHPDGWAVTADHYPGWDHHPEPYWYLLLSHPSLHDPKRTITWATKDLPEKEARSLAERLRAEGAVPHPHPDNNWKRLFADEHDHEQEDNSTRFDRSLNSVLRYSQADPESFHRAIAENPEEHTRSLVYADYLEENNQPTKARFIREVANRGRGVSVQANDLYASPQGKLHHFRDGSSHHAALAFRVGNEPEAPAIRWWLNHLSVEELNGYAEGLRKEGVEVPLYLHPKADQTRLDPERHSRSENPVRYSAVPEEQVHPDYSPTGIAPRVGHTLGELAGENSDLGLLAEAVLRTGDHSLLPILADKLDDDGHPHRETFDWRHLPRGVAIDKALRHELGRLPPRYGVPVDPWSIISAWTRGARGPLSRRRALTEVRKAVPDATREDVYHSLQRLEDRDSVSDSHQVGLRGDATWELPAAHPKDWVISAHNSRLKWLKADTLDSHKYPDTRPEGKRTLYQRLKEKWAVVRYSLADQESFHRVLDTADESDTTPGLVYADWLQEQGKDTHAQVVRHFHHTLGGIFRVAPSREDQRNLKPGQFSATIGPFGNEGKHSINLAQRSSTDPNNVFVWGTLLPLEETKKLVEGLRAEGTAPTVHEEHPVRRARLREQYGLPPEPAPEKYAKQGEGRFVRAGVAVPFSEAHDSLKARGRFNNLGETLSNAVEYTHPEDHLHQLARQALTTGDGTAVMAFVDAVEEAGYEKPGNPHLFPKVRLQGKLLSMGVTGENLDHAIHSVMGDLSDSDPEHTEELTRRYTEAFQNPIKVSSKNFKVRVLKPRPGKYSAYKAPAGGIVVRGVFYSGGSLLPSLDSPAPSPAPAEYRKKSKSPRSLSHLRRHWKRVRKLVAVPGEGEGAESD